MEGAAIAPAVVAGTMGLAGTLVGAALAYALTRRRETISYRADTAQAIAELEKAIWTFTDVGGAELRSRLRVIELRLTRAGVRKDLRDAYLALAHACWRDGYGSASRGNGSTGISRHLLTLKSEVEEMLNQQLFRDRTRVGRWRDTKRLLTKLDAEQLPSPSLDYGPLARVD